MKVALVALIVAALVRAAPNSGGSLVAELLNGELVTSPRPLPHHARAASSLGAELYGPFDRGRGGPGGWIILDEPELHLHEEVLVPDIARLASRAQARVAPG